MKKQLLVTALASTIALSGCATTNTGSNANSGSWNKSAVGAAVGAVLGAGISKATGGSHTERDALIGAAVGGGVGYYMKQQAQQLAKQMEGTGVTVVFDPKTNNINITMPNNVTFDTNSSTVNASDAAELRALAATLKQYNQTSVAIFGHTDSTGSDAINLPLSKKRAISVATFLYNNGIAQNRLFVDGKGSSQPIASNATNAGKAKNRRVEIEIKAPSSLN